MKKTLIILIAACLGVTFTPKAVAQEHKVQAGFIYHFTKYIEWPSSKKNGEFVIGIVGGDMLESSLNQLIQTRNVLGQKITIKRFSTIADVSACHILFLGEGKTSRMEEAVVKSKSLNCLLITEGRGLGKKGASINFVIVDGKLKFEVNKSAIEDAGLRVSSDLLSLGITV